MLKLILAFLFLISTSRAEFNGYKYRKPNRLLGLLGLSLPFLPVHQECNLLPLVFPIHTSQAANLPISNGAIGNVRGTVEALKPIATLSRVVNAAIYSLPNIQKCREILKEVPDAEKEFKRIFDEYSLDVSYKQKFLDQARSS